MARAWGTDIAGFLLLFNIALCDCPHHCCCCCDLQAGLIPDPEDPLDRQRVQMVTGDIAWPSGITADVLSPSILMGKLLEAANDAHDTVMDFEYGRSILVVPELAQEKHLMLNHLTLAGLVQGPGAAGAETLDTADLWTLHMWAIKRCAGPGHMK